MSELWMMRSCVCICRWFPWPWTTMLIGVNSSDEFLCLCHLRCHSAVNCLWVTLATGHCPPPTECNREVALQLKFFPFSHWNLLIIPINQKLWFSSFKVVSCVPVGTEGRAGMAAIVSEDRIVDLKKLNYDFRKALATYARPVFIRILKKLDMTGERSHYDRSEIHGCVKVADRVSFTIYRLWNFFRMRLLSWVFPDGSKLI